MSRYNRNGRAGLLSPPFNGLETGYSKMIRNDIISQTPSLGFLEYLSEGVIIVDNERIIRSVNSALLQLTKWSEAELVGKRCLDFFQCQSPVTNTSLCDQLCPLLRLGSVKSKLSVTYEDISIITKYGERREVSASFAPLDIPLFTGAISGSVEENTSSYTIIVLRDVSEQKRQERIKTEFVATASHQLRTPLSSIKTSINLLLASVDEDFKPPLLRLLNNIKSSSLRMERLVNDLIELTNLQSGRVQLQRRYLEASQIVDKAVELVREPLETRLQTLNIVLPEHPLYVEADYLRIGQVLGHLISNASKFSAEGKKIELEVSTGPNRQVVFSVRDEGIGIAPEEQTLIFEKFYQSQVEENAAQVGGGLGLPLAKALVELNGGKLWLESTPGKGSTFYFSLPAAVQPGMI